MHPFSQTKQTILTALGKNHWIWISALFGAQALGALVAIPLLKLTYGEMLLPLLLLFIGAALSVTMALRSGARSLGKWEYRIPAVIYALFIFSMSHRSFHGAGMPFSGNYFHPLEYASLGIFLCCVWHPIIERRGTAAFSMAVIGVGLIYGITDEAHQAFVPGRDPSLLDLLLDVLGLTVGCGLFLLARKIGGKTLDDRRRLSDNARLNG